MKGRRPTVLALGALAVLESMQLPAASHQLPEPCNANDPGLNIAKDRTYIRPGDTVTYRVEVHNLNTPNGPACDVTEATVALILPAPDGKPTGARTVLASGLDLPAGMPPTQLNPVAWPVALDPGVFDAVSRAELTGVVHDAPTNHWAEVVKTLGTAITAPWTELTAVASPSTGEAPLEVTFTYAEKNTGNSPINGVTMTDDVCAPITFVSGDTDNDQVLDVGETWTLTCTTTLTTPGTVTSHVKSVGNNMQDNRPAPDELASATVTVNAKPEAVTPPRPPEVLGEQLPRELPRTL
jgi:uncharacterized repeat protein (TIGR01451 family)